MAEAKKTVATEATEAVEKAVVKPDDTREIRIKGREVELADGRSFMAFRAVQKDGKMIDCRFRSDCNLIPKESGTITVAAKDMNVNRAGEYPVLWVKHVINFKPQAVNLSAADLF